MKLTAILAVTGTGLKGRASANRCTPTILSQITTPRSGLCLRVKNIKKKTTNLLTPPPQDLLHPPHPPQEAQDESTAGKKSLKQVKYTE